MQMPVNRDSDTPAGAYQVWHRNGDYYEQVGILKVGSLAAAAEVSMNRDHERWTDKEDGLAPATRRTTVDDVIVSPRNGAFRIESTQHGVTFTPTSLWSLQNLLQDIAEERQEALGGVKDALQQGARFVDILRDAAAYGVKPEEVGEIAASVKKEQEQGMEL